MVNGGNDHAYLIGWRVGMSAWCGVMWVASVAPLAPSLNGGLDVTMIPRLQWLSIPLHLPFALAASVTLAVRANLTAAGANHSLALTETGKVYAWGKNEARLVLPP